MRRLLVVADRLHRKNRVLVQRTVLPVLVLRRRQLGQQPYMLLLLLLEYIALLDREVKLRALQ
jgi:hypothetical protein